MKAIFLLGVFVLAGQMVQAQTPDSLFMVTYSLGSSWDKSKSPADQKYFKQHSNHLASLRKAGQIKIGARHSDKGLIIIQARDLAHAKMLIMSDTAISKDLFTTDIQKLQVFYKGCLE